MLSSFYGLLLAATSVLAKVQYAGVNIAGLEFGCDLNGTCVETSVLPPLTTLNGPDGAGQMQHFVADDQLNMFRLPVGWQFLVDNSLGGTLSDTNFGTFDALMQACLQTGAYCVIDIHNYARYNGKIIGQDKGGPTNAQFADLWSQLATKYQKETKAVFGLMNEPHDLNIATWGTTVQAAVTAIRKAGASNQMILLPGTNFTSASAFIDSGSAAALSKVSNPDGSSTNLIFDIHKYLDVDFTGTHAECVSVKPDTIFGPLAKFLKSNKRQALLTETGGGNTTSCLSALCDTTTYLNANSDVFLGYLSWSAGAFDDSYVLSVTPTKDTSGKYVDEELMSQCIVGTRNKSKSSDGRTLAPSLTTFAIMFIGFLFTL